MKYEKMDEFDYLIAFGTLKAKDDDVKAFEELDDSEVDLSKDIEKNIQKMICKDSVQKNNGWKVCKKILSRVAIIMLVLMSVAFVCMMSVSAVREAIWETITGWTKKLEFQDDFVSIGYIHAAGLEEEEPPKEIEQIKKPTLLPDGVEEQVLGSIRTMFSCEYVIDDITYVSFKQFLLNEQVMKIDSEESEVKEIEINRYRALLVTCGKTGYSYISWNDGEYVYLINSQILEAEELVLIAESVK